MRKTPPLIFTMKKPSTKIGLEIKSSQLFLNKDSKTRNDENTGKLWVNIQNKSNIYT